MSHIAFESDAGRVEVSGSERAWMGLYIENLAWAVREQYVDSPFAESAADAYNRKIIHKWSNPDPDNFGKTLGYACLVGNDVTKLLSHIHGQCEIHGWVHSDDGEWFASLIEDAVERGMLRVFEHNNYGSWQDVADLARSSTTPLVSSYSVTDSWPNLYLISTMTDYLVEYDSDNPETLYEGWDALGAEEQNRIADEAIELVAPRWHPAEWGTHWTELARQEILDGSLGVPVRS